MVKLVQKYKNTFPRDKECPICKQQYLDTDETDCLCDLDAIMKVKLKEAFDNGFRMCSNQAYSKSDMLNILVKYQKHLGYPIVMEDILTWIKDNKV